MERVFFSKENFGIIYNIIQKKIMNANGFDINNKEIFNKELVSVMKAVYQQRNTFNIPSNTSNMDFAKELSRKSINVACKYFLDKIKQNEGNITNRNNLNRDIDSGLKRSNHLNDRPAQAKNYMFPKTAKQNFNSQQQQSQSQSKTLPSPIDFKDKFNETSNEDVQKRYMELTNQRNNEYNNSNSNNNNPNINTQNNMIADNTPDDIQNMIDLQQQMQEKLIKQQRHEVQPNSFNNDIGDTSYVNPLQTTVDGSTNLQNQFKSSSNLSNDAKKFPAHQQYLQSHQQQNNYIKNVVNNSNVNDGQNYINMMSDENEQKQKNTFKTTSQVNIQYNREQQLQPQQKEKQNDFENSFEQQFNNNIGNLNNFNGYTTKINYPTNPADLDYNQLLNNIKVDNQINPQFENNLQNANKNENEEKMNNMFPSSLYDENQTKTLASNSNPNNLELDLIKQSIEKQSNKLLSVNSSIDNLVTKINNQDISKFYNTIMDIPRLIKDQKDKPLTIRSHNLIVSSSDRDLSNLSFDKYNFKIVFGAQGNETVRKINYDDTVNSSNSKDKFTQNTQTFTSSGLTNPTVQQVLKNVISIKLKRVIIPKPRQDFYYPEPYYFVSVDEFNSNIISTKSFTSKIFCKIHFDKEFGFDDGRKYLYYLNNDDDFTLFYASPLGKLDRLTLKLLGSDGTSVKSIFNDNDITTVTNLDTNTQEATISNEFYANTFKKDKLYNITTNSYGRITDTELDGSDHKIKANKTINVNDKLLNLTNQVEYIFEIKTQELDPTKDLRPEL